MTPKLVKECKDYLNKMGLRNQITIVWIPETTGVERNEKAEELAQTGSLNPDYRLGRHIPIS